MISENSPARQSGLISYLDFIISANGVALSPDKTLNTIISKSLNCKVSLRVFNILTGELRDVQVQPSNSWGGDGLLGATVRWENWKNTEGLRILEVTPESYAHQLGLRPRDDYILGTESHSINDVQGFEEILNDNKNFTLFVLNGRTAQVRTVEVKSGVRLGCTVGEGMMNSIRAIEVQGSEEVEREEVKVTVLRRKKDLQEGKGVAKDDELVVGLEKKEVKEKEKEKEMEKEKEKEKKEIEPPPPAVSWQKEKPKLTGIIHILPPPSIYDLSMESLTFQPRVMMSKYVQIS